MFKVNLKVLIIFLKWMELKCGADGWKRRNGGKFWGKEGSLSCFKIGKMRGFLKKIGGKSPVFSNY
jgi:hypothetical protein